MNQLFKLSLVPVISLLFIPSNSNAAVLNIGPLNVGPVISIDPASPDAQAGFQIGEEISLSFTFDDSVADLRSAVGAARYEDPNGVITLTGSTSGAILNYFGGVELQFDDNQEFEIDSIPDNALAGNTRILEDDIDFDTRGLAFFSDVDNLSLSLSELNTNFFPNNSSNVAFTEYFDASVMSGDPEEQSIEGMRFGPVPSEPSASTPEPSALIGLAMFSSLLWFRKKQ